MEIKMKKQGLCTFNQVSMGGTYRLDDMIYMRVDLVQRAVCLQNGKMVAVMDSQLVLPITLNCEEV